MPAATHLYEYIKRQLFSKLPGWLFLVGWVLIFFVITIILLLKPAIVIVPKVVGEEHFEGEILADETVSEKKWEIILQSIVLVGLAGGIGLLYRYWEAKRARTEELLEAGRARTEELFEAGRARTERELEAERARAEREREAAREKINLQVAVLREFFGSYIQLHQAYKKIKRKLRARSYQEGKELYIERRDYEQLMDELEDCQLRIESLRRQSQVRVDLFGRHKDSKGLKNQLKGIEDDLRVILSEYETGFSDRRGKPMNEPLLISGSLRVFIEKKKSEDSEQNDDESEQIKNMALARKLILKLIEEKSSQGLN